MQSITHFFSSLSDAFQKQGRFAKLFIVLFGLFILCSFCLLSSVVAISVVNPLLIKRTPTLSPTSTQFSPSTLTVAPAATLFFTDTPTATLQPVATSTLLNNSMSGFELVSLTSPVVAGNYAKASIKTAPGAACSITFTTPSGESSQDAGLASQVANKNGICSWRWLIATGTQYGTGIVSITANGTSRSFEITVIVT